jgi:hypothetical protein
MDEILKMETVYRQERQRWIKEEAPRRSTRDALVSSVPYRIVIGCASALRTVCTAYRQGCISLWGQLSRQLP